MTAPLTDPSFPTSPSWFPHIADLANDVLWFSQMSREDFRAASFLDQRVLTPQIPRQQIAWDALLNVTISPAAPPNWIFHIGHVGSTLISRLLGESDKILSLREPQILRDLAGVAENVDQPWSRWTADTYAQRQAQTVSLLGRTFASDQRSLIKASSFVSTIADHLIGDAKAMFLFVSPKAYIETILAGPASLQETRFMAPDRARRLFDNLEDVPFKLADCNVIELIAASWLCEMTTLVSAARKFGPEQILWLDFDQFLVDPTQAIVDISGFLDANIDPQLAGNLANGPIMRTYSKAPEHAYGTDLRRQLLQQSASQYGPAISQALNWIEKLASQHMLIADTIELSRRYS